MLRCTDLLLIFAKVDAEIIIVFAIELKFLIALLLFLLRLICCANWNKTATIKCFAMQYKFITKVFVFWGGFNQI